MHECIVKESYFKNVHGLCEMNSAISVICIHLRLYNIFGTVLGEIVLNECGVLFTDIVTNHNGICWSGIIRTSQGHDENL